MLKVEFKQIENVVLMKVLEQGDEIKLGCGCFFEHNGIKLCSGSHPEIYLSSLYVKGSSDCAQDIYQSISFGTSKKASEYIMKMTNCIDAYNELVKEKDLLWKPNISDVCYRVNSNYEYVSCFHYLDNPYNKEIIKNFGAFKTIKQAGVVRKHSILMNLLWQLKFTLCPDYEFNKESPYNSFIKFNRENGMFGYTFTSGNYDFTTPVFNRDSVEKAVKYLNSHKELWENLI